MGRVLVCYDRGSASPLELYSAARGRYSLGFVPGSSQHCKDIVPVLKRCGQLLSNPDDGTAMKVAAARAWGPDAVVSFADSTLKLAATIAEATDCAFHSGEEAARLTAKDVQRAALAEAGLTVPVWVVATSVGEALRMAKRLRFPVIVKAVSSTASSLTGMASSESDLAALCSRILSSTAPGVVLVEEMIETGSLAMSSASLAGYVSVESLVARGRHYSLAVTSKFPLVEPFREPGHIWPAGVDEDTSRTAMALARDAVRACSGADGLYHTELMLTSRGPVVIEVNGRLGGFIRDLALAGGCPDPLLLAIEAALGQAPSTVRWNDGSVGAFIYTAMAPMVPYTLRAIHGSQKVLEMDEVQTYRVLKPLNIEQPGAQGTDELDLLVGTGGDLATVLDAVETARRHLSYEMEVSQRVLRFSSHDLHMLNWSRPLHELNNDDSSR